MLFTETEFNELPDELKERAKDKDFGDDITLHEISDFNFNSYINGLKSALTKERDVNKDLNTLKKKQETTIDELRMSHDKELEKMKADGNASAEDILAKEKQHETLLEQTEAKHGEAITAKDKQIAEMNVKMQTKDRKIAVHDAILSADGNPKLLDKTVAEQTATVDGKVVVIDADGETRLTADGKEMTLTDLLADLRDDRDYAGAFKGTGMSGNDSLPGGGDNIKRIGGGLPDKITRHSTPKEKVAYIRKHGNDAFMRATCG